MGLSYNYDAQRRAAFYKYKETNAQTHFCTKPNFVYSYCAKWNTDIQVTLHFILSIIIHNMVLPIFIFINFLGLLFVRLYL